MGNRNGFRLLPLAMWAVVLLFCGTARGQASGGIGAKLLLDTAGGYTLPVVQELVPNTPSVGKLQPGNYIQKVDGKPCRNVGLEQVVGMIRGTEGTPVTLTITDTKAGWLTKDITLTRGVVATNDAPQKDPTDLMEELGAAAVRQLKREGHKVLKAVNSECGDYFFNFEAPTTTVHVRVLILEPAGPAHTCLATGRVFAADNEAQAAALAPTGFSPQGGATVATLEGQLLFSKECVGVVSTKLMGEMTHCKRLYIIAYL